MKQFFRLFLVLAALFSLSACRAQTEDWVLYPMGAGSGFLEENATAEVEKERLIEDGDPRIVSIERKESGEVTIVYHPEELMDLETRWDGGIYCYAESPTQVALYEQILTGEGMIVAGYLEGTREGHYIPDEDGWGETIYTLGQLKIDRVLCGDPEMKEITLCENFFLNYQSRDEICYYKHDSESGEANPLPNGKMKLFFLKPSSLGEGIYYNAINSIPLPADYAQWDEAYLDGFFDYYRGEEDASYDQNVLRYKDPETGLIIEEYVYVLPPDPEQLKKTNEELTAELQDNLYVRIATELKIKVWPYNHIEYKNNQLSN